MIDNLILMNIYVVYIYMYIYTYYFLLSVSLNVRILQIDSSPRRVYESI
jgi:hypothetical protein